MRMLYLDIATLKINRNKENFRKVVPVRWKLCEKVRETVYNLSVEAA